MPKSTKTLLIGSTQSFSGKSGTTVGIIHQLQQQGIVVGYGKPIGTCIRHDSTEIIEEDVEFIAQSLDLPKKQVRSPLLYLDDTAIAKRLHQEDTTDYSASLEAYVQDVNVDLLLLEGAGTLWEGSLFNLSVKQIAEKSDANVLLVARFHSLLLVDHLLASKQQLGDRLLGVVINDIPHSELESVETLVRPFLEAHGVAVFGLLPRDSLLRSVSVRELTKQLKAKVLCRKDRLDLMVETLTIGAMNVNSALEYFRKGRNMAVVTGGDRTDLQLAALETSTHCLILTGHLPPQPLILNRAEDLEIPILTVDFDTLTTVEIVDRAFGQVRLQEMIQVQCIQQLMHEHFDVQRFMKLLEIEPAMTTS